MSYEQRISMAIVPRVMDLEEVATEITERGVSDFWGSMFIWFATQNGFGEKPHPIRILNPGHAVLVIIGFPPHTPAKRQGAFNALDQQMEFKLFDDAATFLIPIKDKKEDTGKEIETKQKIGKDMTAEEIGKVLLDAGVSPLACKKTVRILIRNGYARVVPDAVVARINGKIDFMFGNHEFAESFSLTENPEELDFVYAISTPSNTGRFVYSVENQKETKMYIPKTTIQILKPVYRDRLEKAGLSEEAIRVILDEVFHGKALKAPKEDSSFVILSGKDVLHIYYSHNNKAIGMVNIEATKSTQAGDVIDYSVGIEDATFIVDTSNAQEKLIHRHLGIPKVKLELSSGYSVDIPFKKTYEAVTRDQVLVRITCDALVSVSAKVLENLTGPALADLQGTQADRYFVRGNELTEEVFRKRAALAAGDWTDIE